MQRALPLLVLTVIGCSFPVEDTSGRATEELTGGTPLAAPGALAAVTCSPKLGCFETTAACSGTLISPTVVLTAAHCVIGLAPLSDMRIVFGSGLNAPSEARAIVEAAAHPQWSDASQLTFADYDVGLLRLDTPVAIAPAQILRAGATPLVEGEAVRVQGFGLDYDDTVSYGVAQDGHGTISRLKPLSLRVGSDEVATCGGDSGGPTYVNRHGQEVIAAVHSKSVCGVGVGFTEARVDGVFEDFIVPFVHDLPAPSPPSGPAPTPPPTHDDGGVAPDGSVGARSGCSMQNKPLPAPQWWLPLLVAYGLLRRRAKHSGALRVRAR